jgi:choline dehydrogenase
MSAEFVKRVQSNQARRHGPLTSNVAEVGVMPSIVRGNTNAAVIAIAEKAADLLTGNVAAEEESRAWQEL